MTIDSNTGLVLEGGGMRGVFTSGVLDGFMKHDLYFKHVVAVSAGACNGPRVKHRLSGALRLYWYAPFRNARLHIGCQIALRQIP